MRAALPLALEDGEPAAGRLPPRTAAFAIASAGWCFAVATALLGVAAGWSTALSLPPGLPATPLAAAFCALFWSFSETTAPAPPAENADAIGGVGDLPNLELLETRGMPGPLPTSRGSVEMRPPLPFWAGHGPVVRVATARWNSCEEQTIVFDV